MKQMNPLQCFELCDHEPYLDFDRWTPEQAAAILALGSIAIDLSKWRDSLHENHPLPDDITQLCPWEWKEYWEMLEAYDAMLAVTRTARMLNSKAAPETPVQWCRWAKDKGLSVAHFERFLMAGEVPAFNVARRLKANDRDAETILAAATQLGIDLDNPTPYENGRRSPDKQKLKNYLTVGNGKPPVLSEPRFEKGWSQIGRNKKT